MLIFSALMVFCTWAAVAIILIGLGSLLLKRFDASFILTDAFWMGLAVSVAFLEIWNFILPVSAYASLLLAGAGVSGLILNRSSLLASLRVTWQCSRLPLFLGFAVILLLALRSCGPCEHYDTGLYGASSVRWINTYPVVPGLANLHGRLGFNSSIFFCFAALGQEPWKGLGFHLFTGFVLSAAWATLLPAVVRVVRRHEPASPPDWFYTILAIPVLFWTTRSRIVGTQTDEPVAVVCFLAMGILFEHFYQATACGERKTHASRLVLVTTLLSLAVTFKISSIVFAVLASSFAVRRAWLAGRLEHRSSYVLTALILSSSILIPWCVRGILLSGYPFYPSTLFEFPVAWKVPVSAVQWYAVGVQSYGRIPDVAFHNTLGLHWLGDWMIHALRNRAAFQVPLLISLGGLYLGLTSYFNRKPRPSFPGLSLLYPSIGGLIFWFVAAPDLRFAQFAIWTAAGILGAWGITCVDLEAPRLHSIVLLSLLSSSIWCLVSFGWNEPIQSLRGDKQLQPLQKPTLVQRQTLSGLTVYVPTEGELCWDAPLPCTPYFDESLRLRDSSSLRWGFTSEGRAARLRDY